MNLKRTASCSDLRSVACFVPCYIGLVTLSFFGAWLMNEPERPLHVSASSLAETAPVSLEPARNNEIVVTLARYDEQKRGDSKKPEEHRKQDAEKSASDVTVTMEHGVTVMRHKPMRRTTPARATQEAVVESGSAPPPPALPVCGLSGARPCVCGINSPLPCDPLSGIREPAQGFYKDQPWAYHPLSFKYHPKTDWTYQPRTDWSYKPTKDFTYHPKTDWTYHRRLGVRH